MGTYAGAKEHGSKWPLSNEWFPLARKCYPFGTEHSPPNKTELVRHTAEPLCSGHKDFMSFI